MDEVDEPFQVVAQLSQLQPDCGLRVDLGRFQIALFLQPDGSVVAMDDCCPHMGASLAQGRVEAGVVSCPWHNWKFRTHDGAWVSVPSNKQRLFTVRIEADNILVAIPYT